VGYLFCFEIEYCCVAWADFRLDMKPGWPQTLNPSASQMLGLQESTTIPCYFPLNIHLMQIARIKEDIKISKYYL
jgi:hypothetical protein